MKSRDTALRVKRFEADEKARKVRDLEYMVHEFEQMATDLDRQIKAEEDRTGIKDKAHYSYSTFAKSAIERRDNLLASVQELREKLAVAEQDRSNAEEQLTLSNTAESRQQSRDRLQQDNRSNAVLR